MEQLFGSKTRVKLLKLFTGNPNRPFYVREITRKIDEQINSVRRELANLLSLGIITSDSTNHKLYYEVDQSYEHYDALRLLFTGKKPATKSAKSKKSSAKKPTASSSAATAASPASSTGPGAVERDVWDKVGNISGILYSGAFTRDKKTPVDVMVVGDVTISRVEAAVAELEKEQGEELRYAVMELDEWRYRSQIKDKFYTQVMSAKNQIVLDKEQLFEE